MSYTLFTWHGRSDDDGIPLYRAERVSKPTYQQVQLADLVVKYTPGHGSKVVKDRWGLADPAENIDFKTETEERAEALAKLTEREKKLLGLVK